MIEAIKKYVDSGRPYEVEDLSTQGSSLIRIKLGETGVSIYKEQYLVTVYLKGKLLPRFYPELEWLFKPQSLETQVIEALTGRLGTNGGDSE